MKLLLISLCFLLFVAPAAFAGTPGMPLLHAGQRVTLIQIDPDADQSTVGARSKAAFYQLANSKSESERDKLIAKYLVVIPDGTAATVLEATKRRTDVDSPICVKIVSGKLAGRILWAFRIYVADK